MHDHKITESETSCLATLIMIQYSTDSDLEADLWSMLCCIVTKKRITPYSLIVNIALTFKESSFDNWVKDVEWCEHICSAFLWPGLVMVLINFTSVLFQWCQIKPPVTSRWDEGKKKTCICWFFYTEKKRRADLFNLKYKGSSRKLLYVFGLQRALTLTPLRWSRI